MWSWLLRLLGDYPFAPHPARTGSASARPEPQAPAGPPPDEIVLGIDLGSTHAVAAAARDDELLVIGDRQGGERIPTVVARTPSGAWLVGAAAESRRPLFDVRRLLGRRPSDLSGEDGGPELVAGPGGFARVVIDGEPFWPQELAALLLRRLRTAAEMRLGRRVRWAVLTAPAGSDDAVRQALLDAARIAGFDAAWDFGAGRRTPMRLIPQPVAVGLAHAYSTGRRGRMVVLAEGCAALEVGEGVVEVRAVAGPGPAAHDPFADETEGRTEPMRAALERVLEEAGWRPAEVPEVVLAGCPAGPALAGETFRREGVRPEHGEAAAAVGAAVHGEQLRLGGAARLLLMPAAARTLGAVAGATPLAQGLEIDSGAVTPMVWPRDPLPLERRRTFPAVQKGQTIFCVRVYEGEGATALDLRLRGEVAMSGVGRGRFGRAAVEATLALDVNGFLECSVRDPVTGRVEGRDFREGGLTVAEVEYLAREAEARDHESREAVEKSEARDLANARLAVAEELLAGLGPGERAALAPLLEEVRRRLCGTDSTALREALHQLDRALEGLTHYLTSRRAV